MNDLEKVKEIFLLDVDDETRRENEEHIRSWEKALIENEAFISWQDHEITKSIVEEVRKAYKNMSLTLAFNRDLTETQRLSLYTKQDACLFILSLAEKDAKAQLVQIQNEIANALNVTKY